MHSTIDYSKSPAPAFDAVEDIKSYLGQEEWNRVSPIMAEVSDPREFLFGAVMLGVRGYPVQAWYDLYHGEGSFQKAREALKGESHG